MSRLIRAALFLAAGASVFIRAASASVEMTVLHATREELARGVAASVDGRPYFLQRDGIPEGELESVFQLPGMEEPLAVAIDRNAAGNEGEGDYVVIPVRIEDKILKEGVVLRLVDHEGKELAVRLPVMKVFLPIPKSFPITGVYDKRPDGESGRNLVVTVYPKITKKAKVSLNDSATDGLVIDVKYEGVGAIKFKDFLNRLNRRDLDGSFFMTKKDKPGEKWSFFVRNFFENFDDRDVAVMRDQPLSDNTLAQVRLDNIQSLTSISMGGNLWHLMGENEEGRSLGYVKVGNIDRIIKDHMHSEIGWRLADDFFLKTRFEGLEVRSSDFKAIPALNVDKTGWEVDWRKSEDADTHVTVGNLKFEDYDDIGEIDDHFTFLASSRLAFGKQKQSFRAQKSISWSGGLRFDYAGIGADSWLKGELDLSINHQRKHLIIGRFNEDFFRVTGDQRRSPWQSRFISLMRTRDFFDPNDLLNRFRLDTIFLDFESTRSEKNDEFTNSWKLGVSKFVRFKEYDIPLDFFAELDDSGEIAPSLEVSIRQFL